METLTFPTQISKRLYAQLLEKALALASGLSTRAARKKIVVKRTSGSSSVELSIKMSDPVYAGDVITVPQSFF